MGWMRKTEDRFIVRGFIWKSLMCLFLPSQKHWTVFDCTMTHLHSNSAAFLPFNKGVFETLLEIIKKFNVAYFFSYFSSFSFWFFCCSICFPTRIIFKVEYGCWEMRWEVCMSHPPAEEALWLTRACVCVCACVTGPRRCFLIAPIMTRLLAVSEWLVFAASSLPPEPACANRPPSSVCLPGTLPTWRETKTRGS